MGLVVETRRNKASVLRAVGEGVHTLKARGGGGGDGTSVVGIGVDSTDHVGHGFAVHSLNAFDKIFGDPGTKNRFCGGMSVLAFLSAGIPVLTELRLSTRKRAPHHTPAEALLLFLPSHRRQGAIDAQGWEAVAVRFQYHENLSGAKYFRKIHCKEAPTVVAIASINSFRIPFACFVLSTTLALLRKATALHQT